MTSTAPTFVDPAAVTLTDAFWAPRLAAWRALAKATGALGADVATVSADVAAIGADADTLGADADTLGADADALGADADALGADADALGADADALGADADALSADADTLGADADTLGADADTLGADADAIGADVGAANVPGGAAAGATPDALQRLWHDVVTTRLTVTGGIASRREDGGLGPPYGLPDLTAGTAACAGVGFAMWAARLWCLLDAPDRRAGQVADVLERTLTNHLPAAVALQGDRLFDACPPEPDGEPSFAVGREPGGFTIPPNVAGWLEQIPGLHYARDADGIHVVLYAAGTARIPFRDQTVTLSQATGYPWEGTVTLRITPERPARFSLTLRIPGWARGRPVPGDRYRFSGARAPAPTVWLNEVRVPATPVIGVVGLDRVWEPGDTVRLELPMPVRRLVAPSAGGAERDRVALQRGPLVYCAEGVDHGGRVRDLVLPDAAVLTPAHRPDLLGGVTVLTGTALRDGRPVPFTAVPYAVGGQRGVGEMGVWISNRES